MPPDGAIRTLIVSDIRLYRDGLAELLASRGPISVVATAQSGPEVFELVREHRPDVILLDMAMARSRDLAGQILSFHPGSRLVALGVAETENQVIACAEAGMAGLVTRDSSLEQVVAMVRSVAGGETLCSPRMAAALLRRVHTLAEQQQGPSALRGRLTRREVEILELMDRGLSNKEIASDLCIQPATVKNHVHHILEKLEVRRRGEAVARVRSAGGIAAPAVNQRV
jgi:two-component system, NarL family, nitrate/nitrite response regulator NarL